MNSGQQGQFDDMQVLVVKAGVRVFFVKVRDECCALGGAECRILGGLWRSRLLWQRW